MPSRAESRRFYCGFGPTIAGDSTVRFYTHFRSLRVSLCLVLFFFGLSLVPREFLLLHVGSYNQLKRRASVGAPKQAPPGLPVSHLLCRSRRSPLAFFYVSLLHVGAATAILAHPIWVVKVWTLTAPPNLPARPPARTKGSAVFLPTPNPHFLASYLCHQP